MRIMAQRWATYEEAEQAREEFRFCGACGYTLKIQEEGGAFALRCAKYGAHQSISNSDLEPAP